MQSMNFKMQHRYKQMLEFFMLPVDLLPSKCLELNIFKYIYIYNTTDINFQSLLSVEFFKPISSILTTFVAFAIFKFSHILHFLRSI